MDMLHSGCAGAATRILFLEHCFEQMQMDRNSKSVGILTDYCQAAVSAPVQIHRRELYANALLVRVAPMQCLKQREIVLERYGLRAQRLRDIGAKVRRQAFDELLVGLIDEPVLLPDAIRVRYAHSNVFVGPDDLVGPGLDAF